MLGRPSSFRSGSHRAGSGIDGRNLKSRDLKLLGLFSPLLTLVLALSGVFLAQPQPAHANHPPFLAMLAPWPRDLSWTTTGVPGVGSHATQPNYYAYDFNLSRGALVAASHNGTLLDQKFGFDVGGCDDFYLNQANYVVLNRNDGYSTLYAHLKLNSQKANIGDTIYQGRPIGESNATGKVCGSPPDHLHIALESTPCVGCSPVTNSVPISWNDIGQPAQWSVVTSQNRKKFDAKYHTGSTWHISVPNQTWSEVGQWINTGWEVWYFNVTGYSVRLGTTSPVPGHDQHSQIGGAPTGCVYMATNWYQCNRIRPTTDQVDPGQTAWFAFDIRAPSTPGIYDLYLRTVVEGVEWIGDTGVFWRLDVR